MKKTLRDISLTLMLLFVVRTLIKGGDFHDLFHVSYERILEIITVTALVTAYAGFRRRREIMFVLELHEESRGALGDVTFTLLREEFSHFKQRLSELRSRAGLRVGTEQLDRFAAAFFSVNRGGAYLGVGSTLPSQFHKEYPNYLTSHLLSKRHGDGLADYRILVATQQSILDDFNNDRRAAQFFYERHQDAPGGIILFQIDPEVVTQFASSDDLPSEQVGVWQFGLTCWFSQPNEASGLHNLAINQITPELQRFLLEYFVRLNEFATKITFQRVPQFSQRTTDEKRQDEENIKAILGIDTR